jgi:hypothetical protein
MNAPKSYQAAIESDAQGAADHVAKWRHEFTSLCACLRYATARAQGNRLGWSGGARKALTFAVRAAVKKAW